MDGGSEGSVSSMRIVLCSGSDMRMVRTQIVCEVMVSSGYETASLTDVATQELKMIAHFLFGAYPTSSIQSLSLNI